MSQHDTERIIEEFLGDHPRPDEWRAMRGLLEERLVRMRRARLTFTDNYDMDYRILMLDRQVATLESEEAIAAFVEELLASLISQRAVRE